jgi:integral membrane sensor domain MASE1
VRIRFITNVLGTLTLGPPLVLLVMRRGPLPKNWLARAGEFVLLLGTLAATEHLAPLVSASAVVTSLLYLPLPFLLWAAVRYGTAGVALALLLITLMRFNGAGLGSSGIVLSPDGLAQVQLVLIAMALPFFFWRRCTASVAMSSTRFVSNTNATAWRRTQEASASGTGISRPVTSMSIPRSNACSDMTTMRSRIGWTTGAATCIPMTCRR